MKINCLLVAVFLLVTQLSTAQIQHSIGLQVGWGFNDALQNADVATPAPAPPLLGLSAGFNYRLGIKKWVLETDLLYLQQGHKEIIVFTDDMGTSVEAGYTKHRYHYLAMPIKWGRTIGNGKLLFTPKIGIQAAFCFDRVETFKGYGFTTFGAYNKLDASGLIELEGAFKLDSQIALFLLITGRHSFIDFHPNHPFDIEHYHRNIHASFGIRYDLK